MIFTYTCAWRCPLPQSPQWQERCQAEAFTCQTSGRQTYKVYRWHFKKTTLCLTPLSKQVYPRFQKLLWTSGLYRDSEVPNLLQQQNQRSNQNLNELCDPKVSRCLSPLVGTAGSYIDPVLVPSPTISSPDGVAELKRWQGGGSGRLTFLLSLGKLVPLKNTTFFLQFQVPLGVRQVPHTPD